MRNLRQLFVLAFLSVWLTMNAEWLPRWGAPFWHDAIPETMRQSYIAFGNEYLHQPWASLPVEVFAEFKKTGNRTHYEQLMFEKRRQLAALVMAEVAEGQRRFIPDIIQGLESTLAEIWWGLPAHYKTDHPRVEDQNVDLFNAETASLVAYTRYVLSEEIDRLSPSLTSRIDQEIARRILQPAVKTNYWWKKAAMNWNPWICSNWLACVIFCEKDEGRRTEAVRQIEKACETFIKSYPDDGGCDEGTHYWDRAAASLFETLFLLQKMGHTSLMTTYFNKIQAMESYIYKMYIGHDYVVNFADAHGNRSLLNVNIAYPFGRAMKDSVMCQYAAFVGMQQDIRHHAAKCYRQSGNWPSLARELMFLQHIQPFLLETPCEPMMQEVWMPDLQIMTAREPFVAFKGGHNDESHNHNDVGSFIVYTDGEPLLIDPGVGEYTSKTFSKQRYDIWTMQSDYHNLPRINGCSQHQGKQYAAKVVNRQQGCMTLDLTGAYPQEAQLASWLRTVRVKARKVEITDDFSLKRFEAPTLIMLMTPVKPELTKAGRITLGKHHLRYNKHQLEPAVEDISDQLDSVLRQMWGDHLYRIVLTVKENTLNSKLKYYIE